MRAARSFGGKVQGLEQQIGSGEKCIAHLLATRLRARHPSVVHLNHTLKVRHKTIVYVRCRSGYIAQTWRFKPTTSSFLRVILYLPNPHTYAHSTTILRCELLIGEKRRIMAVDTARFGAEKVQPNDFLIGKTHLSPEIKRSKRVLAAVIVRS